MTDKIKANIEAIRKSRGLTRDQVADMMNVDVGRVKRMEWGKSKIDFESLFLFSDALNIPIIDVITFPDKYVNATELGLNNDHIEANILIKVSKQKGDRMLKLQSIEIS